MSHPVVWGSLVTIGVTIFVLQSWTLNRMPNKEAVEIIQNTKLFDKPIHFGNEAVLFGLVTNAEGPTVELELLWVKKRSEGRVLLVEVFSKDDQWMDMVKGTQKRFAEAPVGELFVEKISVPKETFAAQARLCLAFFSKEEKMAFVTDGPRSFYNRRLNVYSAIAGD